MTMRPLVFLIVSIVTSHGRLIERSTEKIPNIDIKTAQPNQPIRLARGVFDEDTLAFSREYTGQSDEFPQSFTKQAKHFLPSPEQPKLVNISRLTRDSNERGNKSSPKMTTVSSVISVKQNNTLVKKPIAKYNEADDDEDFETRMNKSPTTFVDSGDHEDEDFNLDDYDFDINHDEFASRGKPLEPRTKNKEQIAHHLPVSALKPLSTIETQSKLEIPQNYEIIKNKKERSAKLRTRSVTLKMKEDDYTYDEVTTTRSKNKESKNDGDDYGEENEEIKEYEQKSIRSARSAWNGSSLVDKIGEKTTTIISKVLSVLPMFPQLPHTIGTPKGVTGKQTTSVDNNIAQFNFIS